MRFLRHLAANVADATVAPAFAAPGYRIRRGLFADPDIAVDLAGRTALVTGANSGLGFEVAKALAARGASVHMLCRSEARGRRALEEIEATGPRGSLTLECLDMSCLDAIRAYVQTREDAPVDILVHNAGALVDAKQLTDEGNEVTFATHVLGPFLLTHLLEPALARAKGRVVVVTSGGMYLQRLDLPVLVGDVEPFDGVVAYAQAKRAQVILNHFWAERLAAHGVSHHCMHPGWADTPGVRTSLPRFYRALRPLLRSAAEGADTAIWLAASPEVEGSTGQLWLDRTPQPDHKLARTRETEAERRALLDLVCERTGVHWPP